MSRRYPSDLKAAIERIKNLEGRLLTAQREREVQSGDANATVCKMNTQLDVLVTECDSLRRLLDDCDKSLKQAVKQVQETIEEMAHERARAENAEGRLERTQEAIGVLFASGIIRKERPR